MSCRLCRWRSACRRTKQPLLPERRQFSVWRWWSPSTWWSMPPACYPTICPATSARLGDLCKRPCEWRWWNTCRLCIARWRRRVRPLRKRLPKQVTLPLKLIPKKLSSSKSPGGKHREWSAQSSAPVKHRDSPAGSQSKLYARATKVALPATSADRLPTEPVENPEHRRCTDHLDVAFTRVGHVRNRYGDLAALTTHVG